MTHGRKAAVREEVFNFPVAAGEHLEAAQRKRVGEKDVERKEGKLDEGAEMVRENSW